MSARRSWMVRLSGARSGPPEPNPLPGPGPRARSTAPEPAGPALRVVLVSRDNMLAGALRSLIEAPGGVRMLDWHTEELDSAIRHADVVIVDMPPTLHGRTFAVIDGRFLGRTVVLLQEGESAEALPPGPSRVVLYRPLQIGELWTAITGTIHPVPDDSPPPDPVAPADPEPEVAVPEEPEPAIAAAGEPDPVDGATGEVADAPARVEEPASGMPVAESGRLIGPSGRELEPVIGPGQVAPGMDETTLERLRRWESRSRQSTANEPRPELLRRRGSAAREKARRAKAERGEARQARTARAAARRATRAEELRRVTAARVAAGRAGLGRGVRVGVGGLARPVVVVVMMAAVGLAAAGWRGGGGPDTLAGEVATVRAAGSSEGDLVVQDPRVGPVQPLHALAVGAWLRATEAGSSLRAAEGDASLEAAVQAARAPSRFLLAGAVALTVLLSLLLMRVGPGTGAAAGPGPTPPHGHSRPGGRGPGGAWRLGVAALAGALVALDPSLVREGRVVSGTGLALVLALGALALAWALATRPTLRWLPVVAAVGGLALLVSPLALPMLAAPAVAAVLEGRPREAWRALGALGLAIGLWLVLPIWVAGQDLGPGQAGWLLGRPTGRGSPAASLAASPLSWLLVAAGLVAAILSWRHRSGARPDAAGQAAATEPGTARLLAWVGTTVGGLLVALGVGYPVGQVLPFAVPAAAVALALATGRAVAAPGERSTTRRMGLAGVGVALVGLLAAQGLDWGSRYGRPADDGLGRLVATVADSVPQCAAVNAGGPDDRARLLLAGVRVTEFSTAPAARAAGVRYFVLTGGPAGRGGLATTGLAAWVRQHGERLAEHPSPSFSRVELWRVDAAPLDPVADSLPVPGGVFSNVAGSACGGYRVVDSQSGAFHTAYRALGGKAVLGRPLGSVWTSDGPALQAFDTMVLGAVPASTGQPGVRPIELLPLLAKLDAAAVADAGIPLPSARPPVTDRQARTLLDDRLIARAYLGTDPAAASADDWRRARDRFGRPLGPPQVMPDGAVRQAFERVVLELPVDGGPVRPAALGRLAVRLGLVPRQATELEPVPGLSTRLAETRLDPGPLLRLVAALTALLALAAAAGVLAARRTRTGGGETAAGG